MSGRNINVAIRCRAVLGLAAALATCAAPAVSQTNAVSFPPSRALKDITAWLQHDTPLGPAQVVDISPSAVTAVTSAAPIGQTRGFLATVSSEALDPHIVDEDALASWSIPVEVDCDKRLLRLGAMTGYRSRDLQSDPRVVREADSGWVNPTPSAPLGAVVRGLCDRDFRRPLMGRTGAVASSKSPEPAKSAATVDPPRLALRPAPAAKPGAGGSVAVQVGASPSLTDIQSLLRRFNETFARDLEGLTASVATVQLQGKTVNRALISGFGSAAEASAFCRKLATAGQACFVRR
jgi:SPOR domain